MLSRLAWEEKRGKLGKGGRCRRANLTVTQAECVTSMAQSSKGKSSAQVPAPP